MRKIFIYGILAIALAGSAQAQRCDKYNKYCDIELKDFDYKSQSAFTHMYPGDTLPVKTVLYGNKEYHITVCAEYPEMEWWIVTPYRKTERKIVEVKKDTAYTYKMDEYDEYLVDDETGEYIVEDMDVTVDTVWSSKRVVAEKVIFRKGDSKNDWQKRLKKTQRAFIYVSLPMDADPDGACVAVLIGRAAVKKTSFNHSKSTGESY